jgi:hypothetical protein
MPNQSLFQTGMMYLSEDVFKNNSIMAQLVVNVEFLDLLGGVVED